MLFWSVIILALINIITLVTIWTRNPSPKPLPPDQNIQDGQRIMEQRLQLSDEQALEFEQIRNEHFMRTRPLQDDIHKIRMDLLNEIFSSQSNEQTKENLLSKLNNKQSQLDRYLFQHFQELMNACDNEEQINELKLMLRDLLESTRPRDPRQQPRGPRGNMQPGFRPPLPPGQMNR